MNEIDYIKKLLELGDKEGALKELNSHLKDNPDNTDAWFILANTLDNPEEIKDCFRQIIRVDPNNQQAQENLKHLVDESNKAEDSELPDNRKRFPVVKIMWAIGILCVVLGIIYLLFRPDTKNIPSSTSPIPTDTASFYTKSAESYIPDLVDLPNGYNPSGEVIFGLLGDDTKQSKIGSYALRSYLNPEKITRENEIYGVIFGVFVLDNIAEVDNYYQDYISDWGAKPVDNVGIPVDRLAVNISKKNSDNRANFLIVYTKGNVLIHTECTADHTTETVFDEIIMDCQNIYSRIVLDKLNE